MSWNHLNFAYLDQSRYGVSVERWTRHWPREQLLVMRSEDLYADPAAVLARTREFLGLPKVSEEVEGDLHQNRLPTAAVAPETRQRLWNELATDVERLAALLDTPVWWTQD